MKVLPKAVRVNGILGVSRTLLSDAFDFDLGLHDTGLDPAKTTIHMRRTRVSGPCNHSYRSASTGSSFDARIAGTSPLITPTTSNTRVETASVIIEIFR